MEQTLIILKPDCIKRKLVDDVMSELNKVGLELVHQEEVHATEKQIDEHYKDHTRQSYYENLKQFMISGPIIILIYQGDDVVNIMRSLQGRKDLKNTIRGKYSDPNSRSCENLLHASDSKEEAKREISIWV